MKKLLSILVLAAAAVAAPTQSKAETVELNFSYGGYTAMDAMSTYHNDFYWSGVKTAWGALNAGAYFHVIPKLAIGASYTFSSCDVTVDGYNPSHIYYNVILANAKYQYFSNRIVKLYGHIGLGAEISHYAPKGYTSENKAHFGFQVSPIGATVDLGPTFGIFGEAGFGCQGIIQVGIKLGF